MFAIKLGHYPVILGIKWLQHHNPWIEWEINFAILNSFFCKSECLKTNRSAIIKDMFNVSDISVHINSLSALSDTLTLPLNICMIKALFFGLLSNKADHQCFALFMHKINKAFNIEQKTLKSDSQSRLLKCYGITAQDIDNALTLKKNIDLQTLLPREYWNYEDVFFKKLADTLLPFHSDDYNILLLSGKQPSYSPLREMF